MSKKRKKLGHFSLLAWKNEKKRAFFASKTFGASPSQYRERRFKGFCETSGDLGSLIFAGRVAAFADTGRLAGAAAQIIKFGAAHFALAHHHHRFN
jgi:hypothetical protein